MRRTAGGMAVLAMLGAAAPGAGMAAAREAALEYRIKAACLLHFAEYVVWPPAASDRPFRICIAGEDPFGPGLDRMVSAESVDGARIEVRRSPDDDELAGCRILFVGRSESDRLERIFDRVKDRPVLTVGETEAFRRAGGMIDFIVENNRVRLRINAAAAERTGLKISARLLRLAK